MPPVAGDLQRRQRAIASGPTAPRRPKWMTARVTVPVRCWNLSVHLTVVTRFFVVSVAVNEPRAPPAPAGLGTSCWALSLAPSVLCVTPPAAKPAPASARAAMAAATMARSRFIRNRARTPRSLPDGQARRCHHDLPLPRLAQAHVLVHVDPVRTGLLSLKSTAKAAGPPHRDRVDLRVSGRVHDVDLGRLEAVATSADVDRAAAGRRRIGRRCDRGRGGRRGVPSRSRPVRREAGRRKRGDDDGGWQGEGDAVLRHDRLLLFWLTSAPAGPGLTRTKAFPPGPGSPP